MTSHIYPYANFGSASIATLSREDLAWYVNSSGQIGKESEPAYVFHVIPMGKPRMTQRDKWKGRDVVKRYHQYKDELRLCIHKMDKEDAESLKKATSLDVAFFLPMPKTWSNKKKKDMNMHPHQNKPDIDNLLKAFLDAFMLEDKAVHSVKSQKLWAFNGAIVIKLWSKYGDGNEIKR